MTARHTGADAAMRAGALVGIRSGKSMREIAIDFYGAPVPDSTGIIAQVLARLCGQYTPQKRLLQLPEQTFNV